MDKEAKQAHETIMEHGEAGSPFKVEKDGKVWEGREVAVKSQVLKDDGTGEKYYIRNFIFTKNPTYKGRDLTNQELFNWHWRELNRFLWADGLVAYQEVPPKIARQKDKYVITITCKPKFGISAFDESKTLQDLLPHKSLPKKK